MNTTDELVAGRYRLHEKIGSGGMGVVWRATDELLGRQVALKRIRLDPRTDEATELSRRRTLREARLAAQLNHPHVVSIFDVLSVDGDPWLVLEHVPSESLSAAIRAHGAPGPRTAAGIGIAVADALAAAHGAGIVHRDVKPANVLLGRDGTVKLTDFGIAHAVGDMSLTGTGIVTGTPAYLAPEVARGAESGPASDVYSLGATLYATVEGVPPYRGEDNVFRLLQLVAAGQVPPPQRAGPLEPVLRRLMCPDPAGRPDAVEARDMLRHVLDGRPVPAGTRSRAPEGDRTARVALVVGVVLVVLVLAVILGVTVG